MHVTLPCPVALALSRPMTGRLALSAVSGALMALAMPGIDLGWLA